MKITKETRIGSRVKRVTIDDDKVSAANSDHDDIYTLLRVINAFDLPSAEQKESDQQS